MFRRAVSLLVIAGLIVGQLAAIPHAHGAMSAEEQREHDATPHFHNRWLGHPHHDHAHPHGGHSHSHSAKVHPKHSKPASDDSSTQPLGLVPSGSAHDADAIYLPHAGAPSMTSHKVTIAWALQVGKLTPLAFCFAVSQAKGEDYLRWHPPDEVQDASDYYLTLRNLRI